MYFSAASVSLVAYAIWLKRETVLRMSTIRMLRSSAMKNGLYSVSLKGFDGEDCSHSGVVVLLDGVMLGGGPVYVLHRLVLFQRRYL